MTEHNEYETGLDPEQIFNEGATAERSALQNELSDRLQSELGLSGDEVEALFDPAPRRGRKGRKRGKINCSAKQRATMPQICKGGAARTLDPRPKRRGSRHAARRYDPAPIRQTVRTYVAKARKNKYVKKAKSAGAKLMDKAQPYIPYAVGAGVLYSLYSTHLTELKAASAKNKDGTPVATLVDAVMYDINNWSTIGNGLTGASTRIQEHWKEILGGAVGGLVIQEASRGTKYGKVGSIAGKSAMAIGAAYFIKALLDPPATSQPVRQPIKTVYQPAPQIMQASYQPVQTDSRVRGGDVSYIPPTSDMPANQTNFVRNPF